MKRNMKYLGFYALLLMFLFGCSEVNSPTDTMKASQSAGSENISLEKSSYSSTGKIVIANRSSGSISVIDARADMVSGTYSLPPASNTPEPMYVVYINQTRQVLVGDRANDRVVAFDANTFEVTGTAQTGTGVFHMWADQRGRQLWVNNDIDNTSSVINPRNLQVLSTVPTPSDLVAMGGKPHDVILDHEGKYAYITVLGLPGPNDYVVQFDTRTFQETGRAAVGKDPHLSLTRRNKNLYVPCQGDNAVYILNRLSVAVEKVVSIDGAHGAGMPMHGKTFYTTNLPGGGMAGLIALDTRSNSVIGTTDTPYPVPHNIAITKDAHKLYLTHSGATSDKVTIYSIAPGNPLPVLLGEVSVGLNPFGLAYAK